MMVLYWLYLLLGGGGVYSQDGDCSFNIESQAQAISDSQLQRQCRLLQSSEFRARVDRVPDFGLRIRGLGFRLWGGCNLFRETLSEYVLQEDDMVPREYWSKLAGLGVSGRIESSLVSQN